MNKEQLGAFIAERRKEEHMTQKDLAARLHITDKAVSKWERGLSYPDVTLLEPLAAALGLGVDELMACRRQAEREEDERVKTLLDISRDNLRRERRRGWSRAAGAAVLFLLSGLVIWYASVTVTEQREDTIFLKETIDGVNYLYVREEGHLLRLKCGGGVDFGSVTADEQIYCLDCRWNRRTYRGTVTACQPTDTLSLGGLMDATFDVECVPLFGQDTVYYAEENSYPDPYGEPRGHAYLCDFRCWTGDAAAGTDRTVLLVEDCKSAVVSDIDGDGENEVVVRTRWPEKPYTVYDWVDGEIAETWPDTVPEDIRERLVCIWER